MKFTVFGKERIEKLYLITMCPDKIDNIIEDLKQKILILLDNYEEDKLEIWVQIDDVE
ncbi:MAG: hypothetical protein VZR56_09210 [Treponema sp.]|nr:hypothetical protein [Treponema sp.]